jgi:acyl-coenzyme A synthetase/AMP-(fatty) acid ligase
VVLPDPSPAQDAVSLCRTIARVGVTHTVMIPSLFAAVLDSATPGQLDSLRACGVAGEACEPALVRRHYASLPRAALLNEYGPTEATVWASAHRCPAAEDAGPVPIGRAVVGTSIYLLDRHLRPVAPGQPGELFIGGGHVAWGYVGNTAMTAERFLPDPWSTEPGARMYRTGDLGVARADGEIVFLGRADQQVKLRGYRIEPGEIEAVLAAEPGVAEAVVLLAGMPMPRLLAYVTARPGTTLEPAVLRRAAAARLPDYMVPAVMVLPTLPRLTSGKVDRRALPLPDIEADDGGADPPTEQEAPLAALWGEVLGRGPVPVTRDFFELGGTSLLGMRLVAQIRAKLTAPIELYHLFRHPTVRALAPVVAEARDGAASGTAPIVRRDRRRGTAAPTPDA